MKRADAIRKKRCLVNTTFLPHIYRCPTLVVRYISKPVTPTIQQNPLSTQEPYRPQTLYETIRLSDYLTIPPATPYYQIPLIPDHLIPNS